MGEKGTGAVDNPTATELLAEFQRTGQEAPFAEIARRYGGMVYNVALRVTRDAHDAEDATQATFLTLAVHAKTTGQIRYVGPWLKKVSHRLALDIRRSKKRRQAREHRHAEGNGNANGNGNGHELPVSNGLDIEELRHVLREEIDKLPAKYRLPLILYYFGGLAPEEIGAELRCNTSTLGVRLHRGRKLMAESLRRRGVTVTAAIIAGVLGGLVDSCIRDNLVHYAAHAARTAAHAATKSFVADNVFSAHVIGLMRSARAALRLSRLKAGVAVAVLIASTIVGAGEVLQHYQVLDSSILRKLNPMRLVRPLLDRLLQSPGPRVESGPSPETPQVTVASVTPPPEYHFANDGVFTQLEEVPPLPAIALPKVAATNAPARMPVRATPKQAEMSGPSQAIYVAPTPAHDAPVVAQAASSIDSPAPMALDVVPESSSAIGGGGPGPAIATSLPPAGAGATIVDAASYGPSEVHLATPGTTHVKKLTVGDSTTGSVAQSSGQLTIDEALVLAAQAGSHGMYAVSGDAEIDAPLITVGSAGHGTMTQSSGKVNATTPAHKGTLTIAEKPGSTGTYHKTGGTLTADNIIVGQQGQGTFDQGGGTTAFTTAQLGQEPGGTGVLSVSGGAIEIAQAPEPEPAPADSGMAAMPASMIAALPASVGAAGAVTDGPSPTRAPRIVVGNDGEGTILLNSTGSTGSATIQEQPGARGTSLFVRASIQGNGTLRGRGKVQITGALVQNGQVIGDGGGSHEALDLSTASHVSNTIDNPPDGTNGWFARNGGAVELAPIDVNGNRFYTWGEDANDNVIDLVNSVRFRPRFTSSSPGTMDIWLLDPGNSDAPPLPEGLRAIGLWNISSSVDFNGLNLLVRYDDGLAEELGISQHDLELFVFDDGWEEASGGIDPNSKLIWGTARTPTYFAVGVLSGELSAIQPMSAMAAALSIPSPAVGPMTAPLPEPGGIFAAVAIGAGSLLRRRRR